MAHQNRFVCFSILAVTLATLSCQPAQLLTMTPTNTAAPTPSQTPPPIPTSTRPPTEPSAIMAPFQRVAPLPEELSSTSEEMQLRVPGDGSVWVITSQSVFRWDGQGWDQVQSLEESVQTAVDGNGQLWLFRQDPPESAAWKEGQWVTYGPESGWKSVQTLSNGAPRPWTLLTARDGTLWLSTNWDVRSFDGQRWTIYDREAMGFPALGEEKEYIWIGHQIALANDGAQVWIGECQYSGPGPIYSPGIRWFNGTTWQGGDPAMGTGCITTLDVDPAGSVWAGTLSTLWQYEPAAQRWGSYSLTEAALKSHKFAYPLELMADHSGSIWVYLEYCGGASCGVDYGLLRLQGEEWLEVPGAQAWFVPPQMFADGSGQGWLLGDGTLYRLEGGALKAATSSVVRGIDVSPDGNLWVVIEEGDGATLWMFEPQDMDGRFRQPRQMKKLYRQALNYRNRHEMNQSSFFKQGHMMIKNNETEKLKELLRQKERSTFMAKAGLAAAITDHFGEEAEEVIKSFLKMGARDWAAEGAEADIRANSRNDIQGLVNFLWEPLRQEGFEFTYAHNELGCQLNVTRCPVAEMAKEAHLEKWGFIFHCMGDESICEGYNPAIAFKRTKTLMDHDDYCNHFYYYREPSKNT